MKFSQRLNWFREGYSIHCWPHSQVADPRQSKLGPAPAMFPQYPVLFTNTAHHFLDQLFISHMAAAQHNHKGQQSCHTTTKIYHSMPSSFSNRNRNKYPIFQGIFPWHAVCSLILIIFTRKRKSPGIIGQENKSFLSHLAQLKCLVYCKY